MTTTATQTIHALEFAAPAPDAAATTVVERPVPRPGPGELAIDVTHAGINFKDVMMRRGDAGYVPSWPVVPGIEVAGTVREFGEGVDGPPVGTPVAAFLNRGGLAEVAVVDARLAAVIPAGVDRAHAASAAVVLSTADLTIGDVGRLRAGETILVHSASGAVGEAALQVARAAGAGTVIGAVGNAARAGDAVKAGYDAAYVRGQALVDGVRATTGGRGADLILDSQGTAGLDDDLAVIASGGRIVIFGNAGGGAVDALPPIASRLFLQNLAIAGFSISGLAASDPARVRASLERILARLASGALRTEITVVDGLTAAPAIHDALAAGDARGKYVVRVG